MSIHRLDLALLPKIMLKDSNPIIRNKTFGVYIIDGSYSLRDTRSELEHSRYMINNYIIQPEYCIRIINILSQRRQCQNVCMLGFGLGGLPMEFSKIPHIDCIDAVDIDQGMFEMFNSIIDNPSPKINYYVGDGMQYIRETNVKYDVIIDDAFDTSKVKFDYSAVSSKLNEHGLFIINMIMLNDVNIENLHQYFQNVKKRICHYSILVICSCPIQNV
jgi:spermidine synthase